MAKNEIEYLVFEGGGTKGTAYAGVINVLAKRGILTNLRGVAGTSAGSIAALAIACGYSAEEIEDILLNLDFKQFKDAGMFGLLSAADNLVSFDETGGFGLYKGEALYEYIEDLVHQKTGIKNCTFKQLYKYSGIELCITGTNISRARSEIFSHKYTPKMRVAYAARISASIPFFFECVARKNGGKLCKYIDGGLLNNLPVSVFDNDGDGVLDDNVLGIRLLTDQEQEANRSTSSGDEENYNDNFYMETDSFMSYSNAIIETLLQEIATLRYQLDAGSMDDQIIDVDTDDFSATDMDMTNREKRILVKKGRDAAKIYFKRTK